ncbi:hypothetical protein [Terriglobus sp. TAA 43]|uniref:hypothetical protein n=1 Tax=Terriglobus sp. TAA 43 TaxID=278961 RepID=UPI0012EE582B|nr:hypothetical protein [Terriglobus sp. TAA 43]
MDKFEQNEQIEVEELEHDLRACMRHVPAPEGFTDRVMQRVATREAARNQKSRLTVFASAHKRAGWWTAIAATLLFAIGGDMVHLHHVREARRAAEAQQQLDLALQLTNHALDQVDTSMGRTQAARFTQIALELAK